MSDFRFTDDPALDKPEAKEAAPPAVAPVAAPELPTPSAPDETGANAAPASPAANPFAFTLPAEPESTPKAAPTPKPTPATAPIAPPAPAAPSTLPVASVSAVPALPDLKTLTATPPAAPKPAAPAAPTAPVQAPPRRVAPPAAPAAAATAPTAPPRQPQSPQSPQGAPAQQTPQAPRPPQVAAPQPGQPAGQAPGARAPQPPAPSGTARPAQAPQPKAQQAPQPPTPPGAAGPRPPQPPGAVRPAPQAPAPPAGPQSAANMVAAHGASNVQADGRESGGLQKALWSLDGLVDRYDDYLKYVLYAGAGGTVLSLGFLAMQLFGGKGTAIALGSKLVSNINTASSALGFMLIVLAIGGLAAIWSQKGAGIAMTGLGLLVYFGVPFFLPAQFGVFKSNPSVASYAALQLSNACHIGGMGIAIVGLLKYLIEVMLWIVEMPDRMMKKANIGTGQQMEAAQQRVAKDANALSPCWSLPFCREVIRKQCPAFLARKTCWKFKRGCYCDDEMIARIIRGDSLEKIKAPTKMSQLRKPPCGRCYIYMEHQSHKFRMISPITIPLAVVIMASIWAPFGKAFEPIYVKMDNLQKGLKLFDAPNPIEASAEDRKAVQELGAVDQKQSMLFTQWFIGLISGFLLLVYISKFMEWAVFEAKW